MKDLIKIVLLIGFLSQDIFCQENISQVVYLEGVFFHEKIKIMHNEDKIYSKRITHNKKEAIVLAEFINIGEVKGVIVIKIGIHKRIKVVLNERKPYIYVLKSGVFSPVIIKQKSKQKRYR